MSACAHTRMPVKCDSKTARGTSAFLDCIGLGSWRPVCLTFPPSLLEPHSRLIDFTTFTRRHAIVSHFSTSHLISRHSIRSAHHIATSHKRRVAPNIFSVLPLSLSPHLIISHRIPAAAVQIAAVTLIRTNIDPIHQSQQGSRGGIKHEPIRAPSRWSLSGIRGLTAATARAVLPPWSGHDHDERNTPAAAHNISQQRDL